MNRLILFLIFLPAIVCARALEVSTEPGGLEAAVGESVGAEILTVDGTLDARDFFFIGKAMVRLQQLDLSQASIAAYSGSAVNGLSNYAAGEIPAMSLAGTPLRAVVFPVTDKVSIGDCAFAGCAFESLELPENIVSVGDGAFSSCLELKKVSMFSPCLGSHVFAGCTSLEQADMGTVTAIGESDFAGCTALRSVECDAALTSVGAKAFYGTGLREIDLAASARLEVGPRAFAKCAELTAVKLPSDRVALGDGAFFDCTALEDFDYPGGSASVPAYVLKGAESLVGTLSVPEGVESIGAYALRDASGVAAVVLPAGLEIIGGHAMENMTGLRKIDAKALEAVPAVDEDVWKNVDAPSVVLEVGEDMREAFAAAGQWCDFDIRGQSGLDSPEAVQVGARVSGTVTDGVLYVRSTGMDISVLEVYDVAGRLRRSVEVGAPAAEVDLTALGERVVIVKCLLEQDKYAILKLAF